MATYSLGVDFVPLTSKAPQYSSHDLTDSREYEAALGRKSLRRSWKDLAFDSVLMLLPLGFLGLLLVSASLHRQPESATGNRAQEALLLTPTIFPIIFAAICGKAMKSLALYKSQYGISLRFLEHLAGTTSMFSALERTFLLRNFGMFGIAIVFLWLLSPLGGQALSPRLLSKENFFSNSTQSATYLGPDFLNETSLDSASGAASAISRVTTLYLSSISSSEDVRGSPRDVWGNPKTSIPYSLAGEAGADWTDTVAGQGNASSYTNLIGLPVITFDSGIKSEFVVSSMNLEVQCSSLRQTDTDAFRKGLNETLFSGFAGGGTYPNGTTSIVFQRGLSGSGGVATTFLYVTNSSWYRFASDTTQPIDIFYGSKSNGDAVLSNDNGTVVGFPISLATCTLLPRSLETRLSCDGSSCQAVAARKQKATLDDGVVSTILAIMTRGYFCGMGISSHGEESGQTELFLASGSAASGTYDLVDLWKTPLPVFEERFQQVVNTYWYAASSEIFSTGNISSPATQKYATQSLAVLTTDLGPHYICHWVWFGLAVFIVLLLEVISMANAVLRFRTRIPDMFGFVSSLTIGNRYCEDKGLEQSSALNGLERARALGHVKFQLADVRGADEVGKIAFVPRLPGEDSLQGNDGEPGISRVKFNRYYA